MRRRRTIARARVLALALAVALGACADEKAPPPAVVPPVLDVDGSTSSAPDAGGGDGGVAETDGGLDDAAIDASLPTSACRHDPITDRYRLGEDRSAGREGVSLAASGGAVATTWAEEERGVSQIRVRVLALASDELSPRRDLTAGYVRRGRPRIVALASRYLVAFHDNASGRYEIRAVGLRSDGVPVSEPALASEEAGVDQNVALLPRADGNVLAAWVRYDGSVREARSRVLTREGAPLGASRAISTPEVTPGALALAPKADGALLAFGDSMQNRAVLRHLDAEGAPDGAEIFLDAERNVTGDVALATAEGFGAVVFGARVAGVRPELRLRALDSALAPHGGERALAPMPEGEGARVVAYRGGWAIAYRATDDGSLHVALLDREGRVASDDRVVESITDAPIDVAASIEGDLFIGYTSRDGDTTRFELGRVRCGG